MATTEDAPTPESPAGQLIGGSISGLVLIPVLYAALGTTSTGGLVAWLAAGLGAALLLGALLRLILPFGFAVGVTAAGAFIALALVGLTVVAILGDPPTDGVLALLVGIPAAGLSAVLATVLVRQAREAAAGVALALTLVLAFIGSAVGVPVGSAIDEARRDAALIEKLEASSLSPYLPEIDGLEPELGSTTSQGGATVGYSLRYEGEDESPALSPHVAVDVGALHNFQACDTSDRASYQCREEDGYYVLERAGAVEYVVVERGPASMTASYSPDPSELPDPDVIGRALADAAAESATWDDIVALD